MWVERFFSRIVGNNRGKDGANENGQSQFTDKADTNMGYETINWVALKQKSESFFSDTRMISKVLMCEIIISSIIL